MRHNRLTLSALIVASILLLQIGCQEQAKAPDESKAVLVAVEPETVMQEAETAPPADQPTPKITFEKVVHDFGEISTGKKYEGQFKFTNTGDGLLKITEVKRCCGVVAKLDKEEFAPGESGFLKVEYRSGQSAGTMSRRIYVNSNDQINPKVALTIKAKIVPKVAYEPQRLQLLLKGEKAGCPEITLTSLDNQPFSIKSFNSSRDCITVDVDSSIEATKFVLQPKVDFESLQGRSIGVINFGLTHPDCDGVSIYFSVLPTFNVTPRSLIVFNAEPQKPIVRRVSVQSNYNEDFEVESASSENGSVKVLHQQKVDNGYRFEVEITPPPANDTGNFKDKFYINLMDGEKLSVTTYGRYLKQ